MVQYYFSFTLHYQLEISLQLFVRTNVHLFAEKRPNYAKIGKKFSLKPVPQVLNGFKKLFLR